MEVLYDAAKPAQAKINSFVQLWLLPAGLAIMGLSLILIPTLLYLKDPGKG